MRVTNRMIVLINLAFVLLASAAGSPCQFNIDCDCQLSNVTNELTVSCENCAKFPNFSSSYSRISSLSVSGTFQLLPNRAFDNIIGDLAVINIIRVGNLSLPLSIDYFAFVRHKGEYGQITFLNFQALEDIPRLPLTRAKGLYSLHITSCSIETLKDFSFEDLPLSELYLDNNGLSTIEDQAFNGLETSLKSLSLNDNKLTDVPAESLKNLTVITTLLLNNNLISQLDDDTFDNAQVNNLLKIDFSLNPIEIIGTKFFTNLQSLQYVSFKQCQLTSVPSKALMPLANSAIFVDFSYNKIQYIITYTYQYMLKLSNPGINGNPILRLDSGAFIGMVGLTDLDLKYLRLLQTVDLNIVYGIPNLQELSLNDFSLLENLTASDVDQVPTTLSSISVVDGNLKYVDSNIQTWLKRSNANRLAISGQKHFDCNQDIGWMYEWIFCQFHPQILVKETFCAQTRMHLVEYLKILKPPSSCS